MKDYQDGQGNWRSFDEDFQDSDGNWYKPGESFRDGQRHWIRPGDSWQDSDGNWYKPGESFRDGAGNWVTPLSISTYGDAEDDEDSDHITSSYGTSDSSDSGSVSPLLIYYEAVWSWGGLALPIILTAIGVLDSHNIWTNIGWSYLILGLLPLVLLIPKLLHAAAVHSKGVIIAGVIVLLAGAILCPFLIYRSNGILNDVQEDIVGRTITIGSSGSGSILTLQGKRFDRQTFYFVTDDQLKFTNALYEAQFKNNDLMPEEDVLITTYQEGAYIYSFHVDLFGKVTLQFDGNTYRCELSRDNHIATIHYNG